MLIKAINFTLIKLTTAEDSILSNVEWTIDSLYHLLISNPINNKQYSLIFKGLVKYHTYIHDSLNLTTKYQQI